MDREETKGRRPVRKLLQYFRQEVIRTLMTPRIEIKGWIQEAGA